MSEELRQILIGIDQDDRDENGWWPTSAGVEFGTKKLAEVEFIFHAEQAKNLRLLRQIVELKKEILLCSGSCRD